MLASVLVTAFLSQGASDWPLFVIDVPTAQAGMLDTIPTPDLDGDNRRDLTTVERGHLRSYSSASQAILLDVYAPRLGADSRWIGDANGDGAPDLLVWKSLLPRTVVVRDGVTGAEIYTVQTGSDIVLAGSDEAFGPVGDADGDGTADFWIRVRAVGAGSTHAVRLYSTVGGGLIRSITRTDSPGFGERVDTVPDMNGDGTAEIVVGDSGVFWGVFGASFGRLLVLSPTDGAVLLEILGDGEATRFGEDYQVIGDVDRDGAPDFAVRKQPSSGLDRVTVYSGTTGSRLHELAYPLGNGTAPAAFGVAMDNLGDVDGDGHDDFIVGGGEDSTVFVYSGADGGELLRASGELGFGRGVEGIDDIDGNGTADWAVLSEASTNGIGLTLLEGFSWTRPGTFIDFEVMPLGGAVINNGEALDSGSPLGPEVRLSTSGSGQFGAAAFDTSPTGPNGGGAFPGLLVGSGNAVIIQGNGVQTTAGVFDSPEPAQNGGTLMIELLGRAAPTAIDLIAVDSGRSATVTLTDSERRSRVYTVPAGFTASVQVDPRLARWTLRLDTEEPQEGFAAAATAVGDPGLDMGRLASLSVSFTGPSAIDRLWLRESSASEPGVFKVIPSPDQTDRILDATGINDVNGDGVRDYAVTTLALVGSNSALSVYSGRDSTLLHSTPGISGRNLISIGDINGNGADDLLIGAWASDLVYLYDGATGERLARIESAVPFSNFGWSTTALDDVDGDGLVDFAIGSLEQGLFVVDVFSSATLSRIRRLDTLPPQARWRGVETIHDVDGDQLRDLAVTYSLFQPFNTMGIRVYSAATGAVLLGREGVASGGMTELGSTPFRFNDIDGDGVDDIFLGRMTALSPSGTILSGANLDTLLVLPTSPEIVESVAIADMDGDGLIDIVQWVTGSGLGTGIRVLSGATGEVLFDTTGAYDTGNLVNLSFGSDLEHFAGMGDIDGDGLDDISFSRWGVNASLGLLGFEPGRGVICTGEPNSTGLGARLHPMGSQVFDSNDFTLEAWNLPSTSFVLLLNASTTIPTAGVGSVPLVSDGKLCLSPMSLARHPVLFPVSGGMSVMPVDPASLPTTGAPGFSAAATAGETRYFQCWFRDPGGALGSNLSDAIGVTFAN